MRLPLVVFLTSLLLVIGSPPSNSKTLSDVKSTPRVSSYDIKEIINNLPDGQRWIDHLKNDLLSFWTMDDAFGKPRGAFPTYRANDGTHVDPNSLPPEYKKAMENGLCALVNQNRQDYIRNQARQTYAYGISYHLTGDEKYLKYMKEGVDYFRKHGIDKNGGAYSYKENGVWGPPSLQRTSQDLAYALSGIGFYYYLTRDGDVLQDILNIKKHIFNTYFDEELGLLKWVIEGSSNKACPDDKNTQKQKELVAQLDQIYAYMLWLTPSLPEPYQSEWKRDLHKLATIIIKQFFSAKYQFFWGRITDTSTKKLGEDHTDFGHSIKTLWLIYQIGRLTNDITLINFGKEKAVKIIDIAYIEKSGSWARRFDENGNLDVDKEWWILAELDQTTATLSLIDPSYARYLVHTYEYWFNHMVDKNHKGIWHWVDAETGKHDPKYPKQHNWKNALHSFEHALVGYLTTQQLKGKEIALYYAFKDESSTNFIHPYFYSGKVANIIKNGNKYKVTITDLK